MIGIDPIASMQAAAAAKGVAKLAEAIAVLAQAVRIIEQELQRSDARVTVTAQLGQVEQNLKEALDVLEDWKRRP